LKTTAFIAYVCFARQKYADFSLDIMTGPTSHMNPEQKQFTHSPHSKIRPGSFIGITLNFFYTLDEHLEEQLQKA
jgi:hypothetical protein